MKTKQFGLLLFCMSAVLHASLAKADGLSISPLRVSLSAQVRTAGFTLVSQEPNPTLVQVHLFAWSQQDGVDQLAPTDDLLVGPPIFMIQPGQKQLIRVGLRATPALAREATYRIIIAEVPVQPRSTSGINFAFRLSMPIFITPEKLSAPNVRWSAVKIDALHLRLGLDNPGDQHVQIRSLRILAAPQGKLLQNTPIVSYVLAGQSRTWVLHLDKPLGVVTIHVAASTDQGELEQTIAIQ